MVDSGSTEDTLTIVAREWPEALVLHWPTGKPFSYPATLNMDIAEAKGDLILIASSHTELKGADESPGAWPGRLVNVVDRSSFNGTNGLWNACSLILRKAWQDHPLPEDMPTAEDQAWARWQYDQRDACTVSIRDLVLRYLSREDTVRKSAFEAAVVAK